MATPASDSGGLPSIYRPLNSGNYEIRMLSILPADDAATSMVSCKLETTTLFDTTKYTALSYCWENPNITKNILVENTVIPVTVNLGNALFHLRSMSVTRIWVDALCINQKDNQEKSYQIRNMRYLYEKADVTYSWLGSSWSPNPGAVESMSAMTLLRALFLAENPEFQVEVEHSQEYTVLLPAGSVSPDLHQNCQRCRIDFQFRTLRDFFNLDYWHRCWIIQEVTAATRIQIMYGSESMTWEEMVIAIKHARERATGAKASQQPFCAWEKRPILCEAIIRSRNFQSTDPRDRIFALLGISADGAEIVQTPNYLQALGIISRDITRSLIRKNGRLEIILLGKNTVQVTQQELPTWSPNWFSQELALDSHLVAGLKHVTKHSIVSDIVSRHGDTLEVEGMCIGSIVDSTTSLIPGVSPQNGPLPQHQPIFLEHQANSYYQNSSNTITALLDCLTLAPWQHDGDIAEEFRYACASMIPKMFTTYSAKRKHLGFYFEIEIILMHYLYNHIFPWVMLRWFFLAWCQSHNTRQCFGTTHINPTSYFSTWLQANQSFTIDGRSLASWLTRQRRLIWSIIDDLYQRQIVAVLLPISLFIAWGYFIIAMDRFMGATVWTVFILGLPTFFMVMTVMAAMTQLGFNDLGYRSVPPMTLRKFMDHSALYIHDSRNPPKKILLFNRGFIGMTFAETQIGDVAYFLLGCEKAVLLREVVIRNQIQHRVVGEVSLWLSARDRVLYKPFVAHMGNEMGIPGFTSWWQVSFRRGEMEPHTSDDYHTLIEAFRQNGLMERLELV